MDNSKTFGYGRVSSKGQSLERQKQAFLDFGIDPRNMYFDIITGSTFDREQYNLLKQILREGDLLVIQSIDRLGRSYEKIVENYKIIVKDIKADLVVLDMPLLDTRQNKDLLGTFISDLVLQLLSYVAQTEKEKINIRQKQGIDAAFKTKTTKTGRWFGRPRKILPDNFNELYPKWKNKEITSKEFMQQTNLKPYVFYNFIREYENKNN